MLAGRGEFPCAASEWASWVDERETTVDTPGIPALRRNRDYRRVWLGQAVSLLGDEVLDTAIMLWVGLVAAGGSSWGPAAAAGVLAARTVPVLLFGMIGGVYSDRRDRRRTMLLMDVIRGGLVCGLAVVLLVGADLPVGVRLGVIYAVVALCAVAAQFFNPARYGLLATVVADADRERMGSITAGTGALAAIVGPALAAALLVFADIGWSLLFTAAMFAISYTAVAGIRVGRPSGAPADTVPDGLWRELTAGLRFFAGNRLLKVMLGTTVMVVVGVSAINTLDIFFVTRNLHAPVQVYGLLGTAFGIGSLVGAGLAAAFATRLRATRVYSYGFVLVGVLLVGYSRTTTPVGAVIVVFCTGIPVAVVNSMVGPLVMRAAPAQLIGRVSSVLQPATQLASLASVALSAWLASVVLPDLDGTFAGVHFGAIDTIFLGAGVIIATTGVWAVHALRATT
jgi:MFS family permease